MYKEKATDSYFKQGTLTVGRNSTSSTFCNEVNTKSIVDLKNVNGDVKVTYNEHTKQVVVTITKTII